MDSDDRTQRRSRAAAQFDQHANRDDGLRVTGSLSDGLNILRDSFFTRVHEDVEVVFGEDSMLMPLSAEKGEVETKQEIELYQIAESAAAVKINRYLAADEAWFVEWLTRLRFGDDSASQRVAQRISYYSSKTDDARRLAFATVLEGVFPEAARAPLIVYRLLPLAVGITTALAFGDLRGAEKLRKQQISLLPAIIECHQCRGALLENGEPCRECGNPLWKYRWLTAAD
jgi:hypothetical protein